MSLIVNLILNTTQFFDIFIIFLLLKLKKQKKTRVDYLLFVNKIA